MASAHDRVGVGDREERDADHHRERRAARDARMPGSASGLRVTACIVVPAIASAAPTRIASTVRGMRATTAACETPSDVAAECRR